VGAVRGPAAKAEALLLLLTGEWMTTVTAWYAEAATAVAAGLAELGEGLADALGEPAARVADGLADEVADASRCLACDCWLLSSRATEAIADAGI